MSFHGLWSINRKKRRTRLSEDLIHTEKFNQMAGMEPALCCKLPEAIPSAAPARRVADLSYTNQTKTNVCTNNVCS